MLRLLVLSWLLGALAVGGCAVGTTLERGGGDDDDGAAGAGGGAQSAGGAGGAGGVGGAAATTSTSTSTSTSAASGSSSSASASSSSGGGMPCLNCVGTCPLITSDSACFVDCVANQNAQSCLYDNGICTCVF